MKEVLSLGGGGSDMVPEVIFPFKSGPGSTSPLANIYFSFAVDDPYLPPYYPKITMRYFFLLLGTQRCKAQ